MTSTTGSGFGIEGAEVELIDCVASGCASHGVVGLGDSSGAARFGNRRSGTVRVREERGERRAHSRRGGGAHVIVLVERKRSVRCRVDRLRGRGHG